MPAGFPPVLQGEREVDRAGHKAVGGAVQLVSQVLDLGPQVGFHRKRQDSGAARQHSRGLPPRQPQAVQEIETPAHGGHAVRQHLQPRRSSIIALHSHLRRLSLHDTGCKRLSSDGLPTQPKVVPGGFVEGK